jgi:hypothetical protein
MTEPFNKATITFEFEHKEDAKASFLIGTPIYVNVRTGKSRGPGADVLIMSKA